MLLVKVFILSCNIFFNSLEFKLPVDSIKPPILSLDSSTVSRIFFITFSSTPLAVRFFIKVSVVLGLDNLVKSPSNNKSFNCL